MTPEGHIFVIAVEAFITGSLVTTLYYIIVDKNTK